MMNSMIKRIFSSILIFGTLLTLPAFAQGTGKAKALAAKSTVADCPLSTLEFTSKDAIYTTYAAPQSRTDYKTDQAYELMWTNPEKSIGFQSKSGGEMGMLLTCGQEVRTSLCQYSSEPVICGTFSDLVKLTYKPFVNLNVEATFCVYSSNACIMEYSVTNTSGSAISILLYPYFMRNQGISGINTTPGSGFTFKHDIPRDGWMVEHAIPVAEHYTDAFICSDKPLSMGIYDSMPSSSDLLKGKLNDVHNRPSGKLLLLQQPLLLQSGETRTYRIIRYTHDASKVTDPENKARALVNIDLANIFRESEAAYSKIPVLHSADALPADEKKDRLGLYYSAFTLMRQCMMPAEGKCHYNYYVFSREPKWGWGYGGQVFHESLSMLAYVYMDPIGAMNSQRVFMERQSADGYINYRTGPYLDEMILTDSVRTCSAPWFNYINYELYRVTGDKKFLLESYDSGRKLYNWFLANRDKDGDGLYEWGGDGTLECVRDGLVATWDRVSKPENLEGPDLNSMLVKEAICLSLMAKELNKTSDAGHWMDMARKHAARVNQQLWDPMTGFYYNTLLSTNGFTFIENNDLKIKEIIGFLPMWANFCTGDQAKALVNSLSNPEEFWRPYGIPTLSAKDPYYNPMGYWNGPAWTQWQYLVFRGLIDYQYTPLALQLGNRVTDQLGWHLKNDHTFWEFYSPDDRQAGWNKTYIWAGIVARMMLDMEGQRK